MLKTIISCCDRRDINDVKQKRHLPLFDGVPQGGRTDSIVDKRKEGFLHQQLQQEITTGPPMPIQGFKLMRITWVSKTTSLAEVGIRS